MGYKFGVRLLLLGGGRKGRRRGSEGKRWMGMGRGMGDFVWIVIGEEFFVWLIILRLIRI